MFSDYPWSLLVSFGQLFKLPLVVQCCDVICEWPLIIWEAPKNISRIFGPFLAIFTLFHWKNQLYLQKPDLRNLHETRFWLLLVNNTLSNRRTVYIMHLELNRQGEGDIQLCLWSCFNGIFVTLRRNKVFTFSMTNIKYFLTIWKIAFCHLSH